MGGGIAVGNDAYKKTSKFLSLVLRHDPGAAGIRLDDHGWADVKELIHGVNETARRNRISVGAI